MTVLVGDIGGTNVRFAVASAAGPSISLTPPVREQCRAYPSLVAAIDAYLARAGLLERPRSVVMAVAGPVVDGAATLTNLGWSVSEPELRSAGFDDALVINDFAALALAAPALTPDQAAPIGPDLPGCAVSPMAVIGAGTGFGAALLARSPGGSVAVSTEGGHIGFAPCGPVEREVCAFLERRFGRVSIERILSGPGLSNLHEALAAIRGEPAAPMPPDLIVAAANDGDQAALRTVHTFSEILGSVAGDFALAYGARGGVFLAGGVSLAVRAHLTDGGFRARFEDKGRFAAFMQDIPTRLVIDPYAALIGAARAGLRVTDPA